MMRRALGCLAFLGACSSPPTQPETATAEAPAVVSLAAPPDSAATAGATATVRKTTDPLPLANPDKTVCELSIANLHRPPAFRLKPDGSSFATVFRMTDAHAFVPKDPISKGVLIRGAVGPVELTGIANTGELEVYANGEPKLAGVFVPDGNTALRFANADVGVVRLAMPTPPIELTDLAGPLDAEMTCAEVSLSWGKGDLSKTFKSHEAGLLVGEKIPLSAEAKGKTVTQLVPPGDLREVTVLEKAPTAVRIAWRLRNGWVIGWVAKSAVKPGKPRGGESFGGGSGSTRPPLPPARESRSCKGEIALGVELDGASAIVGRIKPDAVLDLYEDDGERVSVSVREATMRKSEGARFFVKASDIKGCAVLPPPKP